MHGLRVDRDAARLVLDANGLHRCRLGPARLRLHQIQVLEAALASTTTTLRRGHQACRLALRLGLVAWRHFFQSLNFLDGLRPLLSLGPGFLLGRVVCQALANSGSNLEILSLGAFKVRVVPHQDCPFGILALLFLFSALRGHLRLQVRVEAHVLRFPDVLRAARHTLGLLANRHHTAIGFLATTANLGEHSGRLALLRWRDHDSDVVILTAKFDWCAVEELRRRATACWNIELVLGLLSFIGSALLLPEHHGLVLLFHKLLLLQDKVLVLSQHLFLKFSAFGCECLFRFLLLPEELDLELIHPSFLFQFGKLGLVLQLHLLLLQLGFLKFDLLLGDALQPGPLLLVLPLALLCSGGFGSCLGLPLFLGGLVSLVLRLELSFLCGGRFTSKLRQCLLLLPEAGLCLERGRVGRECLHFFFIATCDTQWLEQLHSFRRVVLIICQNSVSVASHVGLSSLTLQGLDAVHLVGLRRTDVALLSLEQSALMAFRDSGVRSHGMVCRFLRLALLLLRGLEQEVFMLPHDALLLGDEAEDV